MKTDPLTISDGSDGTSSTNGSKASRKAVLSGALATLGLVSYCMTGASASASTSQIIGGQVGSKIQEGLWFEHITGVPENDFRKSPGSFMKLHDDNYVSVGPYNAGQFSTPSVREVMASLTTSASNAGRKASITIDTTNTGSPLVDVMHLQSIPTNENAMFQAASNFNGVEAIGPSSYPDRNNFVTDYLYDRTQGPAASISAGPGAIARVYAAFASTSTAASKWAQTKTKQVEFLDTLKRYFTVNNGYVEQDGTETDLANAPADLFLDVKVGLHAHTPVTFGLRAGGNLDVYSTPQNVHQAFVAAMNLSQGSSGVANRRAKDSEAKARLLLKGAYWGTYATAVKLGCSKIFLTLVGGGVFGNSRNWIVDAIESAHAEFAMGKYPKSKIAEVHVVVYRSDSAIEKDFLPLKRLVGSDAYEIVYHK